MPNYFVYTYATAGVLAILLALFGLSPMIINYGTRDTSLFIGMLSYAYFLSASLMLTLLIPSFRQEIIGKLGKKIIFIQVALTVPFLLWGTMMVILLLQKPA